MFEKYFLFVLVIKQIANKQKRQKGKPGNLITVHEKQKMRREGSVFICIVSLLAVSGHRSVHFIIVIRSVSHLFQAYNSLWSGWSNTRKV
jgi:hypothetical protein